MKINIMSGEDYAMDFSKHLDGKVDVLEGTVTFWDHKCSINVDSAEAFHVIARSFNVKNIRKYMPIYYIILRGDVNGREISDKFSVGLIGTEEIEQFLKKYGGAYNFYDPRR